MVVLQLLFQYNAAGVLINYNNYYYAFCAENRNNHQKTYGMIFSSYLAQLTCHIDDSRAKLSDLLGDFSDEALSVSQWGSKDLILSVRTATSAAIILFAGADSKV